MSAVKSVRAKSRAKSGQASMCMSPYGASPDRKPSTRTTRKRGAAADRAIVGSSSMGLTPDQPSIRRRKVAKPGPAICAAQPNEPTPDRDQIIAEITQLWRMRQRWHRAEKSLILQGRAVCRAWTAGDKDEAAKLFDAVTQGADGADPILIVALQPFLAARDQFEPERKAIEKRLRALARSLPIWPWVANVKGFGDLNLAAIVGEAGDAGCYRTPACLWKRMGLAVIGVERQRKKTNAEEAAAHGYNPARRAVAYLLGDTLIKANGDGKYRTLYLARKEYEAARTDEGAAKTKAHIHNRSARYMVKRALRDLWSAWRATGQETSATLSQRAGGPND